MIFGCKFLFASHTLSEQCTYLGYFLLEAPREYVQHGPLVSINRLWLCPQSGAHVRSHAVRRRLFIVLMTAAHISPNVFSLRNFLSNVHVQFLIIHSTSSILIIHHIRTSNYIFLFTWRVHSFISSVLHSKLAVLSLLCLIHYWPAKYTCETPPGTNWWRCTHVRHPGTTGWQGTHMSTPPWDFEWRGTHVKHPRE
jgi:hypothetical protein